jgi:hypothetical protein
VRSTCARALVLVLIFQSCVILDGTAQQPTIPLCGSGDSGPHAPRSDGENRSCDPHGQRHYVPRHKGIGFEILDSESQACFVPDQEYRLLDDLIDSVPNRVKYDSTTTSLAQAKTISEAISDALLENGFALFIDRESRGPQSRKMESC